MRRITTFVILSILLTVAASAVYLSQAPDPLVGTWKFNPQKSVMQLTLPPRQLTRKYETRGGGLYIFTQNGRSADGSRLYSMYVARTDGQEYPLFIGDADEQDTTISFKSIDASTVEQIEKQGNRVISTATRKVSPDGKTMTLIVKARPAGAQEGAGGPTTETDTMVFEKQ